MSNKVCVRSGVAETGTLCIFYITYDFLLLFCFYFRIFRRVDFRWSQILLCSPLFISKNKRKMLDILFLFASFYFCFLVGCFYIKIYLNFSFPPRIFLPVFTSLPVTSHDIRFSVFYVNSFPNENGEKKIDRN